MPTLAPIWSFPCHVCGDVMDTIDWQPGDQCLKCGAVVPQYPNAQRVQPSEVLPLGLGPFPQIVNESTEFLGRCPHCYDAEVRWPMPRGDESFRCPPVVAPAR